MTSRETTYLVVADDKCRLGGKPASSFVIDKEVSKSETISLKYDHLVRMTLVFRFNIDGPDVSFGQESGVY